MAQDKQNLVPWQRKRDGLQISQFVILLPAWTTVEFQYICTITIITLVVKRNFNPLRSKENIKLGRLYLKLCQLDLNSSYVHFSVYSYFAYGFINAILQEMARQLNSLPVGLDWMKVQRQPAGLVQSPAVQEALWDIASYVWLIGHSKFSGLVALDLHKWLKKELRQMQQAQGRRANCPRPQV